MQAGELTLAQRRPSRPSSFSRSPAFSFRSRRNASVRSLRTPLGWNPILYGCPRDRLAVKLGFGVWFRLDVLAASVLLELLFVLACSGVPLGAGELLGDGVENTRCGGWCWGCGCCSWGWGWGWDIAWCGCGVDTDAALPVRWWPLSRAAYVVVIGW